MAYLKYNNPNTWVIYLKSDSLPSPTIDEKTGRILMPGPSPEQQAGQMVSQEVNVSQHPTRKNMITIIPGLNPEIPDEIWNQIKDTLDVKQALDNGSLEVLAVPVSKVRPVSVETPITGEKTNLPGTLEGMDAVKAIEMVKACSHEKALEVWLDKEQRTGVIDAIKKQLEILNNITNPDKKK